MTKELPPWHGYWVASPTPFTTDGALDQPALGELMKLYVNHGVHGILINGSTGEWWAQSDAERRLAVRIACEATEGRVPVLAGISHFTATQALDLARAAAEDGAAGVLATVPPYINPTEAEALNWYRTIAENSPVPLMVYNWPRGVGLDLPVPLLDQLADLDNVAAIKDSSGDELKTIRALELVDGRVRFFARFISRRGLALLRGLGGDGNIDGGGIGAIFAARFYEAVWADDLAAAEDALARYQRISQAMVRQDYSGRFGSPVAQLKALMRHLGQPGGYVRQPLLEVAEEELIRDLKPVLQETGLLEELDAAATAMSKAGTVGGDGAA